MKKSRTLVSLFGIFSVSGTGGKAIPGREIKEIQFLGVDYIRQKWDKDGIYSTNKPFPNLTLLHLPKSP